MVKLMTRDELTACAGVDTPVGVTSLIVGVDTLVGVTILVACDTGAVGSGDGIEVPTGGPHAVRQRARMIKQHRIDRLPGNSYHSQQRVICIYQGAACKVQKLPLMIYYVNLH